MARGLSPAEEILCAAILWFLIRVEMYGDHKGHLVFLNFQWNRELVLSGIVYAV